jgi:methyl-accepting chemotaxis protein
MKNLSVSKKLLLGFGVACILMLIIGVVTFATSISRNADLDDLNDLTDFQTYVRDVNIKFGFARIELRSVYTSSLDNDAELEKAKSYLTDTKNAIDAGATVSKDRLEGKFDAKSADMAAQYAVLLTAIDNLHKADINIRDLSAAMVTEGENISQTMIEFMNYLMENQQEAYAAQDDETYLRRTGFLLRGDDLTGYVTKLRLAGRSLALNQDVSVLPEVSATMNELIEATDDFYASTKTERTRAHLDMLRTAADDYNNAVHAIGTAKTDSDKFVAEARAISDVLLGVAQDILTEIDGEVTHTLDDTISTSTATLIILTLLVVFAIIVSVIFGILIANSISKPVNDMMGYIKQAGETGNLNFRDEEWAHCNELSQSKDEIGQMAAAFTPMMRKFVYYGECLGDIANNDFTRDIKTLGDNDTMGNALVIVTSALNEAFGEINNATTQVAEGSKQIADSAQTLAQGSTQQAAAVEELSASIADIAEKTRENSTQANRAAALSKTIKTNAETGSRQMDEMITAVKDINEASQNIEKIIKVIDDIAFQTNILALNAAVEAARAGQHGKGFAVVAEEVRNLAAKSATAASDTGTLIQNSMEKAELGAKIAEETAVSLAEIVDGINKSTTIVGNIATSSDEQSAAIAQINTGIDQVAQVVQANSATSQESAATAEELSGQSSVLDNLVAQFKLKDGSSTAKLTGGRKKLGSVALPAKSSGEDYGKY